MREVVEEIACIEIDAVTHADAFAETYLTSKAVLYEFGSHAPTLRDEADCARQACLARRHWTEWNPRRRTEIADAVWTDDAEAAPVGDFQHVALEVLSFG
jgi:hypothetical protein